MSRPSPCGREEARLRKQKANYRKTSATLLQRSKGEEERSPPLRSSSSAGSLANTMPVLPSCPGESPHSGTFMRQEHGYTLSPSTEDVGKALNHSRALAMRATHLHRCSQPNTKSGARSESQQQRQKAGGSIKPNQVCVLQTPLSQACQRM